MLQRHNCLKNFTVEFVRKIKICAQYSSAVHQNKAWQDLNVLIINAKKYQKRIKKNIKFIKRRWSNETMNQLIFEIRNHHVANEIFKFIKKYSITFEKIMKKLQLTIFKRKEKMNWNIRMIVIYILNDFKRGHSKIYFNFFCVDSKEFSRCWFNDQRYKIDKEFSNKCFFWWWFRWEFLNHCNQSWYY